MKQLLYFLYYVKETDRKKFRTFFSYAKKESGKKSLELAWDLFFSTFKYKVSILDYFYFRFYKLNAKERSAYAGTGFMYEYQLKMNPKEHRDILEDKILFLKKFTHFVHRIHANVNELKSSPSIIESLLSNSSGKIVLKGSRGQVGAEVEVCNTSDFSSDTLIPYMEKHAFDLVEEFVVQHPDLMKLSDTGLNTVRIFTQLDNVNNVVFLGARLRISVNSKVDNMAAGNLAAPIDIETGVVSESAVYSDITKELNVEFHPVTEARILGFKLPFWKETIELITNASLEISENRSIGWDIAISEKGPELIEGNHNWCKLLWQLPVRKGLKEKLLLFL